MNDQVNSKENSIDENNSNNNSVSNSNNISENPYEENTNISPQTNNSNIFKKIGSFLIGIITSIAMGLFNFARSNLLLLLILGSIIYGIYYVYSNFSKFINNFFNLFKEIQPILKSGVDIIDTTVSSLDLSNNIKSLQTSSNSLSSNSDTLENKLQNRKIQKDLDKQEDSDDEDKDDIKEDESENNNDSYKKFNTDNLSKTNSKHKTGLEGYCFIGNENGIRSCAPVGKNNKCMSGDIFPTMEICMNPKLRE